MLSQLRDKDDANWGKSVEGFCVCFLPYLIFPLLYRSKTYTFLLSWWKIRFQKAAIAYTLICMTLEGTKIFKKS